mmetsp:Transcript_36824/g.78518  ORF Transcript_36824/g.78518 Transcript_36824/m.78518 type:complete len:94 (+) Transcript_36824:776-1057(+)
MVSLRNFHDVHDGRCRHVLDGRAPTTKLFAPEVYTCVCSRGSSILGLIISILPGIQVVDDVSGSGMWVVFDKFPKDTKSSKGDTKDVKEWSDG